MNFPITVTKEIYNKLKKEHKEAEKNKQYLYCLQAEAIINFLESLCEDT